jgi:hypothetical protein
MIDHYKIIYDVLRLSRFLLMPLLLVLYILSCDHGDKSIGNLKSTILLLDSSKRKERDNALRKLIKAGAKAKPLLSDLAVSQGPVGVRARRIIFAIDHPVEQLGQTLKSFRNSSESWRLFLWQAKPHIDEVCIERPFNVIKKAFETCGFTPLEPWGDKPFTYYECSFASETWGKNGWLSVDYLINIAIDTMDKSQKVNYTSLTIRLNVNKPYEELMKYEQLLHDDILAEALRNPGLVKEAEEYPLVKTIKLHMDTWLRGGPREERELELWHGSNQGNTLTTP